MEEKVVMVHANLISRLLARNGGFFCHSRERLYENYKTHYYQCSLLSITEIQPVVHVEP